MSTAANHERMTGADEALSAALLERIDEPDAGVATRVFSIGVPADWEYVRGHFPGFPVVPGAALLISVVRGRVRECWPELGAPRSVRRLKFKRVVSPGDDLVLRLERRAGADGDPRVRFQLTRDEAPCCSGELRFAGARGGGERGREA